MEDPRAEMMGGSRMLLREAAPLLLFVGGIAALAAAFLFVSTVDRYAEAAIKQANKCAVQIEKALTAK